MGRSVSTPSGAAVTVYVHVDHSAYYCRTCAHCREDEPEVDGPDAECPRCEAKDRIPDIQFDEHTTHVNWESDIENLTHALRAAFPSLTPCNRGLGGGRSEDHAILENRHAAVSVSEYCGLVAVCLVPEARNSYDDPSATAHHWCAQVEAKFRKVVADTFGALAGRSWGA